MKKLLCAMNLSLPPVYQAQIRDATTSGSSCSSYNQFIAYCLSCEELSFLRKELVLVHRVLRDLNFREKFRIVCRGAIFPSYVQLGDLT
ncbi:hypothetical protein F2Q69_00019938 [Brassica cretica]|uniref:Uncharacterized protein n=1 Tax=Brassica cretica TaxID=69181 RepID=A0A8S9QJ16_BRACR|nr:hypothetical protein F2Q69_00019938 [Brassica cretica]